MSRLVQHDAKAPVKVDPKSGSSVWICQCGLSRNQPYCDGSHSSCRSEEKNKLYEYDESQVRKELPQKPKFSVYRLRE